MKWIVLVSFLVLAGCSNEEKPGVMETVNAKSHADVLIQTKEYLGREIQIGEDLALIVEPIPGEDCNGTICVAEVYLNSAAILQSGWLGENVRKPFAETELTFGTQCQIVQEAKERGYFEWQNGEEPESAIFLAWNEDGSDYLAATGWNWYSTLWNGGTYVGEPDKFWDMVEALLSGCE